MRLLVVSPFFAPAFNSGGATRSIWTLVLGMQRAGTEVRVITTDACSASAVPRRRVEHGVDITTARSRPSIGGPRFAFAPGMIGPLWRSAGAADVGVFQGVWTFPLAVASRIARLRGLPYVLYARGALEEHSRQEKALRKRLYWGAIESATVRAARAVVFASAEECRRSRAALGAVRSIVVPNAIELAGSSPPDRRELRDRLGVTDEDRLIGMSGRIHPRKGIDVMLETLAGCDRRIHLVYFGSDEEGCLAACRARADALGIGARLHVTGYLAGDELRAAYAGLDLLVLPSHGESFGNVVLEALAMGTPAMVSDRVPLGRYLLEHGLGTVVDELQPRAWIDALHRWLERSDPRDRDRAARRVEQDFDPESIGRRFLAQLDLVTHPHRPA